MWIRLLTITGLFLCFIALYCELPQPPPGPEKVTVELGYELPDGEIVKENYLTDTTGNQVKICMFLNLTQYLDSVVLEITMGSDFVKMCSFSTYTGQTATATYPIIFSDPGNYTVTLTGYVEGELKTVSGTITIVSRPQINQNRKPVLNVKEIEKIGVNQELIFSVSANDSDANQQVTISASEMPGNATFSANLFKWTPRITDTGTVNVIFTATDNGSPVLSTSKSVIIIVGTTPVNGSDDTTGPAITLVTPNKDSITTSTSSYTVVVKCTDASGVLSVNGATGATSYTGVRDTGSTWKITIGTLQNNKVTAIVLTATDSSIKANAKLDTVFIKSEIVNGYTITFDKNDSAATGTMANQTINSGDSARLSTNVFVKDGSTFAGWMTSPAGISAAYADGAVYKMGTSSVTLYAKWNRKTTFKLTINATNGSVDKSPNAVSYDSGTVVTLTPVPTGNYHFSGWTGALTGTTNPATIIMNSEKSVTAGFEVNPPNSFSLTVIAENGTVAKSPDATQYDSATVVSLTATPSPGYQFTGWTGDLSGTTNIASITMTGVKSVTANFTIKKYALTVNATNGSVAKSPDANHYDSGTVVSLTATPSPGFQFTGWTGDLSGTTNIASITMTGVKSVTANFTIKKYALTVNATNGSVAKSPDANQYDSGTVVSLTATPSPGFQFTGWTGDLSGTTNIASITMTGAKSITANFAIKKYALTVNATNGTVAKSPDATQYDSTTVVSLTATPSPGYQFTGWTGDLSGTTNPASINMTGAKSVTANFAIKKFALTVNTTNGTVAKSPNATQYDSGTVVSLTATPSPGYQFTGWTADLSGSTNPASINMTEAKSVTANFTIKKYALTVNATNGTVAKSPNATSYDSGTVVSLTATPSPGYQFTGWSGGISGTTNPSSITMNGEKSVTANFGVIVFSVTYNANGGTGTVPVDPGSYTSGSLATVLPNSGKLVKNSESFIGWSNGGIGTIIACGQKIYISGNVTLYAQYSAYEVMDNDGNRYGTVTIGGKTWMDKNLKTTKFDNGDPIPFVEDEGAWKSLTMGAYCWPMNNIANKEYGALYNWYTVNTGNLAPAGWHVATASDWYELVDSLGCDSIACKIKETGETHWASPNECATNSSYFYALGNGSRGRLGLGEDAGFQGFKEFATWWTSTKYFVPSSNYGYLFFIMNSLTENCSKNDFTDATVGYGVRCVKDE